MSDLARELREDASTYNPTSGPRNMREAADLIEVLEASADRDAKLLMEKNDRIRVLETALREVANNEICKLEYCECKYMARRALRLRQETN